MKGWLGTSDLLVKIACLVKKKSFVSIKKELIRTSQCKEVNCIELSLSSPIKQGPLNGGKWLGTSDLLVKIACLVKKKSFVSIKKELIQTSQHKEVNCIELSLSSPIKQGPLNGGKWLGTVDLLVKIACLVKKKILVIAEKELIWTSQYKEVKCTVPSLSVMIP